MYVCVCMYIYIYIKQEEHRERAYSQSAKDKRARKILRISISTSKSTHNICQLSVFLLCFMAIVICCYFHVEITIRNMLQALLFLTSLDNYRKFWVAHSNHLSPKSRPRSICGMLSFRMPQVTLT